MIPFFGCDREYMADQWEYLRITNEVLSTGRWLQGRSVQQLEEAFEAKFSRQCVAVNSCTDALFFALKALGVGPGDEVLVPAFSFLASATCVLRVGATPILVDVDRDTGLMDFTNISNFVSDKTKALIIVHLYGNMISYDDTKWFQEIYPSIPIVEDAAQALGSHIITDDGLQFFAGSLGDIACFSFDPTKTIPAPGSGGVLLVKDEKLWEKLRKLRYHGRKMELGYNSQMSSLTAAFLQFKLSKQRVWDSRRRYIAKRYRSEIDAEFMELTPGCTSNYHKFVIKVPLRAKFVTDMYEQGVEVKVHYSQSLDQLPMFEGVCPNANYLAEHVVSLPIHPYLTNEEVGQVIKATNQCLDMQ